MERTVANIIGSPSFQFDKRTDDIMDIDPVLNFLYRLLGDQMREGLRVFIESNFGLRIAELSF